jgi:hypothetical protein
LVRSAATLAGNKVGTSDAITDATTPTGSPNGATGKTGGGQAPSGQGGSGPSIFGSGSGSKELAFAGGGGGEAASAGDGKGKGQTYGGAGGKPAADPGAVEPSSFFGELNGERNPAGQDTQFGAALDGTKTMGTADPDDYFTRVGLDDNIFRIVSRRYRAKAFSWASVQSQANFQEASHATVKK